MSGITIIRFGQYLNIVHWWITALCGYSWLYFRLYYTYHRGHILHDMVDRYGISVTNDHRYVPLV